VGAHWCHLANAIELSTCGGDAACCQITLTTCYLNILVVKIGVIEVTFQEDSDGFISLVGRPLTRPRTNSLASSVIREDLSSACVASSATASSELPTTEKPTDQISHGHDYCEASAGPGHRSAEMHVFFARFCYFILPGSMILLQFSVPKWYVNNKSFLLPSACLLQCSWLWLVMSLMMGK